MKEEKKAWGKKERSLAGAQVIEEEDAHEGN